MIPATPESANRNNCWKKNQQLAVAQALQIDRIQLSYQTFLTYHAQLQKMRNVLVSVHSVKEAVQAWL